MKIGREILSKQPLRRIYYILIASANLIKAKTKRLSHSAATNCTSNLSLKLMFALGVLQGAGAFFLWRLSDESSSLDALCSNYVRKRVTAGRIPEEAPHQPLH